MDSNEQNDTNNEFKPAGAPVVDIQPPNSAKHSDVSGGSTEDPINTGPITDDTPSIASETDLGVAPKDDAPVPVTQPTQESPAPSSYNKPDLSMPELPEHAKKKSPMLAIIIIVVLALGLAGGAVYLYMKTKDSTKNTQTTTTTTTSTTEAPITKMNVDNTIKEVDEAVTSLDDTKDLNESDLTDTTLGL